MLCVKYLEEGLAHHGGFLILSALLKLSCVGGARFPLGFRF